MELKFKKNHLKKRAGHYRISDVAKLIDRSPMTIIRLEKEGLIPKAEKDSRGWRIYTEDTIEKILNLVKRTKYFTK